MPEEEKDVYIQYVCNSLSFFSRWKLGSYQRLVFPAAVENEIVSEAISSLSLLPTHG